MSGDATGVVAGASFTAASQWASESERRDLGMPDETTLNPAKRTRVRKDIFSSVSELADIALQRRTWLDAANTNPHWTYIEFCCSYPDLEQLAFNRDHNIISAEEFEALTPLCDAIVSHDPPDNRLRDHVAILDDPAWHQVIALAERVRQRLIVLVSNPDERQCLLDWA